MQNGNLLGPSQDAVPAHPPERALGRYAANEMGPGTQKRLKGHLQQCSECRTRVGNMRELARRFKDFERMAITSVTTPPCSGRSLRHDKYAQPLAP